jgi:hypothetical protein
MLVLGRFLTGAVLVFACSAIASAQVQSPAPLASAAPSASPQPTPTPSPTPGFSIRVAGSDTFVDQAPSGPGLSPPEAADFEAGLPRSPMTPYDFFTSAPTTPGIMGEVQYFFTFSDRTPGFTADLTASLAAFSGDVNTSLYWGEPLLGHIDAHEGRPLFNYNIAFPTKAGENDTAVGLLQLPYAFSIHGNDGSWRLSGGYVNVQQTDRFVFAPPAITSVNPAAGMSIAETLGPGSPSIDAWTPSASTLPLLGVDASVTKGTTTLELTNALLPVLEGTTARLQMASLVDDRGDFGRFSAQVMHVTTAGDPITTTTYFGTDQHLYPGSQGRLFSSVLADQDQTIAGVRALFHPLRGDDVLIEFGRAWYTDGLAAEPGTSGPGNYQHYAFTRHFGTNADAGVEYYRFDPRYATVILPYGVPENVWAVAWSWPGQWLKSTYQAVDNSNVGINRAGYRIHADATEGRLELHADAYVWRQLEPITLSNASQQGWVDGFFLPQYDAEGTLGWQRQVNLYGAWHLERDDIAVDTVWDRSYRPYLTDPSDFVRMNYPQIIGSVTHHWSKAALATVGFGRYSANGMWSQTPVQAIYTVGYAGAQWDFSNGQQLLLQVSRYGTTGLPSEAGGPPPTVRGWGLVVDHRIAF